jgi:molybdate transport system ATP-binding protein
VARLADHIVVLQKGRAVATDPLAETLARFDLPIQLGDDAGVAIEGMIAEHDRSGTWPGAIVTVTISGCAMPDIR